MDEQFFLFFFLETGELSLLKAPQCLSAIILSNVWGVNTEI